MAPPYVPSPTSTPASPGYQLVLEILAIIVALLAFLAIFITGCYGPIGWNNEWPLIRALPKRWKYHIYPWRVDDPSRIDTPHELS
ncbi:hypothetical protein J7T55_008172 [Diaporthe amygdali]|uniref:uncharacterized protein n=1 Tax=Phomopsis amygdali TaxID=1214568 RepID=UPI0022FF31E1|nr:uncharacterized protein J7T55_008172 [Diaporthe amygdali]KAJ0121012.1 hypothetical protein J7T55_008172 [Diaporthe amygdali]